MKDYIEDISDSDLERCLLQSRLRNYKVVSKALLLAVDNPLP